MTKRMADSINPAALPAGYDAYLGYVDGTWADLKAVAAEHGNVPVYGLSVTGGSISSGVDTEPGNVDVEGAAAALAADKTFGVDRPIGYCMESQAAALVAAAGRHGLSASPFRSQRSDWRLLTAHTGWGPHICAPFTCGSPVEADGTQWAQNIPGLNGGLIDESLLDDTFTAAAPHPGPPPPKPAPAAPDPPLPIPVKETTMQMTTDANGNLVVAGEAADNGNLLVFTQPRTGGAWNVTDVTAAVHNENPADPRAYKIH